MNFLKDLLAAIAAPLINLIGNYFSRRRASKAAVAETRLKDAKASQQLDDKLWKARKQPPKAKKNDIHFRG